MQEFESELRRFVETHSPSVTHTLNDATYYSLFSGGKRIRPRLIFSVAEALALSQQQTLSLALATELFHSFSLVHDDLPALDNDDYRRGKPTVHRTFGEDQALLAGDSILALSFKALEPYLQPAPSVFPFFFECIGASGVIGGQSLEIQSKNKMTIELLDQIHDLKTAALFRFSTAAPALLDPSYQTCFFKPLRQLGTDLGLAFQAADDLEDIEKTSSESLLHFKKPQEIIRSYSERLEAGMKRVSSLKWPGDIDPLLQTCRAVLGKLTSVNE